jgi:hypothetical protein
MRIFSDWKYFIALIASVAGVVVPVWLWQADLNSKSLSIRLITRVSLNSVDNKTFPDIELSINGSKLTNPTLIEFIVKNDGSRPILATDFESPLEIRLESASSFVKTRVSNKTPRDIDPIISSENKQITLKPMLINPQDSITISTYTSGDSPVFGYKARVAGVSNVSYEDDSINKPSKFKLSFLFFSSLATIIPYFETGDRPRLIAHFLITGTSPL